MSVFIDLIGSVLIGAFVILTGLQLNENIVANIDSSNAYLNVQEDLVNTVRTIEYDFRKIGFGLLDPKTAIKLSSPTAIRFEGDMNRDGTMDQIQWFAARYHYVSGDSTIALYRSMNGTTPLLMALNVTEFKLAYLKEDGTPADTSAKSQIWIIETTLKVESPYEVADQALGYSKMSKVKGFWRQTRLASRNVKRHG